MQQAVEGALAPAGPPSKRPKQLDIRSILGAAGGQRQFVEQRQQGPRWAPAPPPDAAADAAEPAPVPAAEAAAEEEPFNFDFDDDDDVDEEAEEGSGATAGSSSTWRGMLRMFSQEWFTVASFPYDAAMRAWKASAQFRHSE